MIKEHYHFDHIDSTNVKAKELANAGAVHGTLVTADTQNAGVGRRGRSWSSEKGTGIYMSMILRPEIGTEHVSMLTLIAAMAVEKALKANDIGKEPYIKWPNDIVINKKKICGILTELILKGTEIDFVIIGIGINVSNQKFPEEIQDMASSILLETGKVIEKEALIQEIWKQFHTYYERFLQTLDLRLFKEEYEACLVNKNQVVKVLDPAGEYEGTATGITNTGELIVDTGAEQKEVSSGEVSVRGIYGYV